MDELWDKAPEKTAAAGRIRRTRSATPYAEAGVDRSMASLAKDRITRIARRSFNKNVLSEIGGFNGLFALDAERFPDPVLVSSADGVGTKLKVAAATGLHQSVWRGPGQPLRERHRGAGRDTAVLPGLLRQWND